MRKEDIIALSLKVNNLSDDEKKLRDLYLRNLSNGTLYGPKTGYASIDKPELRFYDEKVIFEEVPNMSAYQFMTKCNTNNASCLALYYFGKKYYYRNLIQKIEATAEALRANGIKKGDVVSVALPNIPENVFVFYALNSIGATANIIDLRLKGDMLVSAVNNPNSKMLFGCDLFLSNINDVIDRLSLDKVVVVSPATSLPPLVKQLYKMNDKTKKIFNPEFESWDKFISTKCDHDFVVEEVSEDTPACILYTSGTTGEPKGVVLKNKSFNYMALQYRYLGVRYNTGDRFMSHSPTFLAYNIIISTHVPLSLGMSVVMFPEYNPSKFAENVMKNKIQHVLAGPADWANFLENDKVGKADLSRLVTMGSGSAKLDDSKKQKINDLIASRGGKHRVLEGYGQTEVGSAACSNLPNIDVPNSVGVAYPKMNIAIFDDDNIELLYGQQGNICISGPTMMKEYFNNPEETDEVLVKHPDGSVWVHTGDLGYMDEDGVLYLMGRKKRQISRYDGQKISPYDIEKVVDELKFVDSSCVVGVDDLVHGAGSVPCINVVPNADYQMSENEMRGFILDACALQLSDKYCVGEVRFLDELPLTPVGKVDYRKLTKICNEQIKSSKSNVNVKVI